MQVIWFEIRDNTDAIATFIRINMGKIQLTNSELVKALFLQERNFGDNDEVARIRQLEIAGEWNSMENSLQDENLWWFLNREENPLPARIEFVLDLIREIDVMHDPRLPQKIGDDRFSTFRYFFQRIGESDDYEVIRNEWKRIKDYHNRILEFYENPEWYHYIGFLIHCGKEVPELLDAILSCKTKDEITEKLETMIKEKFAGLDVNRNGGGSLIIDLSYPDDRRKIREILLLFNLEYIVKQCKEKRAIQKFPFQAFAEQKWDIEHIDSATANPLKDRAAQEEWMKAAKEDVPEIAGDKKLSKRIEAFLGNKKSTEACDFEQIQADIIKLSGEDETSQDKKNSLGNLVLLDSGMNRSYRNALFPTKRRMIIEKDMRGAFIPICTKNTFLKYFDTDGTRSRTKWNHDDIEQSSAFITKTLERFLPVKGKKK